MIRTRGFICTMGLTLRMMVDRKESNSVVYRGTTLYNINEEEEVLSGINDWFTLR